jgi:hypothetical protein
VDVPKNRIFIIDERSRMSIRETREIFDSYSELTQYLPDYFPPAQGVVQKEAEEGRVYDNDDEDANGTQVAAYFTGTKVLASRHQRTNTDARGREFHAVIRHAVHRAQVYTGTKVLAYWYTSANTDEWERSAPDPRALSAEGGRLDTHISYLDEQLPLEQVAVLAATDETAAKN